MGSPPDSHRSIRIDLGAENRGSFGKGAGLTCVKFSVVLPAEGQLGLPETVKNRKSVTLKEKVFQVEANW